MRALQWYKRSRPPAGKFGPGFCKVRPSPLAESGSGRFLVVPQWMCHIPAALMWHGACIRIYLAWNGVYDDFNLVPFYSDPCCE